MAIQHECCKLALDRGRKTSIESKLTVNPAIVVAAHAMVRAIRVDQKRRIKLDPLLEQEFSNGAEDFGGGGHVFTCVTCSGLDQDQLDALEDLSQGMTVKQMVRYNLSFGHCYSY